jgi:hypothetical protein
VSQKTIDNLKNFGKSFRAQLIVRFLGLLALGNQQNSQNLIQPFKSNKQQTK